MLKAKLEFPKCYMSLKRYCKTFHLRSTMYNVMVTYDTFIFLPGIIRFFGYLAQSRPAEVTQQYPIFLQTVFSFLTVPDPALKLIAIQTIGAVAHSEQGLRVVFDDKERNDEIMKILCNNISSSEADVKGRSLEALAMIVHSADIPSEDLSLLTRSLFSAMATNPLQILMDVSKQPFQDVHCAVLKVFRSLAKYKWAQEDMTTCPGKTNKNIVYHF